MNLAHFKDYKNIEGRLQIQKYYGDGSTENIFEENNLIVLESKQKLLNTIYSTPIDIASYTFSGRLVVATTGGDHNFTNGQVVIITGVTPAEYNGIFAVKVLTSTTFQYSTLDIVAQAGTGSTMRAYPVPAPDPIVNLKIGIGGGLDSRSIDECSVSQNTDQLITTGSAGTFLATDVGQRITIPGAGPGGSILDVSIIAYVSPTEVTISENAYVTATLVNVTIGQGLFPRQEDPAQVDLIAPVATLPVTYTLDLTIPSVTFLADADQSTANGLLLTEAGLFKASGSIFNVKNHPGIPKTSDFGVHYVWTIKYS